MSFIRKAFYPHNPDGPKIEIPRKLTEFRSHAAPHRRKPAGNPGTAPGASLPHWACAILKVMHTIGHR